ncbi:hypothetical protein B0T24DRAFT_422835 [Lasiosphaeria ovina]|uniref:Uncharacterized protein n=1 Tax=Lasiosphaeria ovina TaxID=92902 RepID=A0AAE0MZX4_9PEZI|nr:hypothetical protein B0T24DRAFT_422835 [Lasiosphaeria ovina]
MHTPGGTFLSFPSPLLLEPSASSTITEMGEIPIPSPLLLEPNSPDTITEMGEIPISSIFDAVDGDDVKPAPQEDTEAFSNAPDSGYVEFIPNYSSTSVLGRRLTHFFNGFAETRRARAAAAAAAKGEAKGEAKVEGEGEGEGKGEAKAPARRAHRAAAVKSKDKAPARRARAAAAAAAKGKGKTPARRARAAATAAAAKGKGKGKGKTPARRARAAATAAAAKGKGKGKAPAFLPDPLAALSSLSNPSDPEEWGQQGTGNGDSSNMRPSPPSAEAVMTHFSEALDFGSYLGASAVVVGGDNTEPSMMLPPPTDSYLSMLGSGYHNAFAAADTAVSFPWDAVSPYIEDSQWFAPSHRGDDVVTQASDPPAATASPAPPSVGGGCVGGQAPAPPEHIYLTADTPPMQPADSGVDYSLLYDITMQDCFTSSKSSSMTSFAQTMSPSSLSSSLPLPPAIAAASPLRPRPAATTPAQLQQQPSPPHLTALDSPAAAALGSLPPVRSSPPAEFLSILEQHPLKAPSTPVILRQTQFNPLAPKGDYIHHGLVSWEFVSQYGRPW